MAINNYFVENNKSDGVLRSIAAEVKHNLMAGMYAVGEAVGTLGRDQIAKIDASDFDVESATDEELSGFIKANAFGMMMQFPLSLKKADAPDNEFWTLPIEPMISITGKNVIVKRTVNKSQTRGTVKERWCQDDYDVNIQGVLINPDIDEFYPWNYVGQLRDLCESASLIVSNPLLEFFGITRICVDSFDIPFTSGLGNQNYSIKACSDDYDKLFLTKGILNGK